MIRKTTVALCVFIAILAGLTADGRAEVRLTIKEVKAIRPTHDGRYFGRPSLQVLADGIWVMAYIHSDHHWACHDGQIEVMFSADEGRTWTPPNTCVGGKPVSGLPSAASPKESTYDPGEPYIYLAPNGDLIITAMDVTTPSPAMKGRPLHLNGCSWITVSSDDGRTWSNWSKATLRNVPDSAHLDGIDLTQDSFLDGNVIYASSRVRDRDSNKSGIWKTLPGLFKSTDNGRTWEFVSFCDPERNWNRSSDPEIGLERVGDTELVAVIRGNLSAADTPFLTRSLDMGKTWSKPARASSIVQSWKRPRIYTLKHLKHLSRGEAIPKWWNDDILVGTGVHQVSARPGIRNVALWHSEDKGKTWSAPLDLDENTPDAGYGDMRMRKNGDLVVVSYHGAPDQASIKQYLVGVETKE